MTVFRIVIVGCGAMSKAWFEYALSRPDCELVGLVDLNRESAEARSREYGLALPCFTNLDEALKAVSPNLLFDITIPESHTAVTRAGLRFGCDVLGEKPLSTTVEEARETVRLAETLRRNYSVMQNRRYLKNIRAFKGLVDRIGSVGIVNSDFYIGAHFGGFRDLMANPLLLDMAIHTFDQARFLSGADAVNVWCKESNPSWSWYKGASSAVCVFEMSNGAVFTYRGSWSAEGLSTSWESDWRIVGSLGTARWDGKDSPEAEIVDPEAEGFQRQGRPLKAVFEWTGREGHQGCLDEMFQALSEGRKAETDCADNLKSLEMVLAAIESSQTGATVQLRT